jgi:hypothetical protein
MVKSGSSSQYSYSIDHASGQNAAAERSDELGKLRASHLQQMMADPTAAIGNADRIRQLQAYLNAYRGNYQLPGQEVIPRSRMASEQNSFSDSISDS